MASAADGSRTVNSLTPPATNETARPSSASAAAWREFRLPRAAGESRRRRGRCRRRSPLRAVRPWCRADSRRDSQIERDADNRQVSATRSEARRPTEANPEHWDAASRGASHAGGERRPGISARNLFREFQLSNSNLPAFLGRENLTRPVPMWEGGRFQFTLSSVDVLGEKLKS